MSNKNVHHEAAVVQGPTGDDDEINLQKASMMEMVMKTAIS